MLASPLDFALAPRDALAREVSRHGSFDLAPTRDCDSLIATFAMFIARLSRCTQFDLAFTEARSPIASATLRIHLDTAATVAAMHCEVDSALARARSELDHARSAPDLPVGIALVERLDDPLPDTRLLMLVLSRAGAARWHFDEEAFSRAHIHALADRFTRLLSLRATARWSRAPVGGVPLNIFSSPVAYPAKVQGSGTASNGQPAVTVPRR